MYANQSVPKTTPNTATEVVPAPRSIRRAVRLTMIAQATMKYAIHRIHCRHLRLFRQAKQP
jgi:hypothetical protein